MQFREREMRNGNAPVEVIRNVERSPHHHLKLFELLGLIEGANDHISNW